MTGRSLVWEVARWEFRRFFKAKDVVLSAVLIVVIGLAMKAVGTVASRADSRAVTVAVAPLAQSPLAAGSHGRFELVAAAPGDAAADEAGLRRRVVDGELDGALLLADRDRGELLVAGEADWSRELVGLLTEARTAERLTDSGIAADTLAAVLRPVDLEVRSASGGERRTGKVAVGIMVGLMVMGVLVGNSLLFVGITGEKGQRVTEQVVSALKPQSWIDGKLVGLSGLVVVNLSVYVVSYLIYKVLAAAIWQEPLGLPEMVASPSLLAPSLLFAVLGFLLWFAFFALIACTINDPNTSARSTFMFLPVATLALAFAGLNQPDALWMRLLGLCPLTSPSVFPVRLALGDANRWELVLAVALLVVSIAVLRRAAGKVFALGMLMYGKEPSFAEIWRWSRATRA